MRNCSKIDQMATKFNDIFHCKALQNWPKLVFFVWNTHTIWQSWFQLRPKPFTKVGKRVFLHPGWRNRRVRMYDHVWLCQSFRRVFQFAKMVYCAASRQRKILILNVDLLDFDLKCGFTRFRFEIGIYSLIPASARSVRNNF
jgi:hypothetical protein